MLLKGKMMFVIGLFCFFASMGELKGAHLSAANDWVEKDTIKVLAIGNSFSQDALEFYLHGLAKAAHIPVVIGNLSIGGASLALHWDNASNDKAAYAYRKIAADGKKQYRGNVTLSEALSDQDWDYISFQQVSHNA